MSYKSTDWTVIRQVLLARRIGRLGKSTRLSRRPTIKDDVINERAIPWIAPWRHTFISQPQIRVGRIAIVQFGPNCVASLG
jgi:hypothetical protein